MLCPRESARFILIATFISAATLPAVELAAGGWFDLPKPSATSRVLAAAGSDTNLIFALDEVQDGRFGARMVVYDRDLKVQTSWWIPGDVSSAAITSKSVAAVIRRSVRTDDSIVDTYQVCPYAFDGSPGDTCLKISGSPEALVGVAGKIFGVSSLRVSELNFQHQRAIPVSSIALLNDGPVLVSSDRNRIVRVGSETLNGAVVDLSAGTDKALSFMSPQLEAYSKEQSRYPSNTRQPLAWHVVGLDDSSLLVFPGRFNPSKGFHVDRFDSSGSYTGTLVLQMLSFPEFKRAPSGNPPIGNRDGFLRPSLVVRIADRLILVDQVEGRCAWYAIANL